MPRSLLLLAALTLAAQPPRPVRLYELREMDMHLHAGLEREVPLDAWFDLAARDGRKVIVALDHLELYREGERKKEFKVSYPYGAAGHRALWADIDRAAAARPDLRIFKGWEIYEGELDTGLEEEPMRHVDVIGWHISPNHRGAPPDGKLMIRRIGQILEVQRRFAVPMIVFHPFSMRLEHIQRKARAAGRDLKDVRTAEYRFFQPGEQAEVVRLLKGTSVYIEISNDEARYVADPACRQALMEDIRPLVEAGVQFTVSTDTHSLAAASKPFVPAVLASLYGLRPAHTNGIVSRLLDKAR
ncbi:MAG: hypothetical protein HZB13_16550 [Acidobacteria bacterium]|nr:hypothetical protein [Acidobacteriota bacterium]